MKKKDKIVVWPAYFDSNKTRLQGRRVARSLAVAAPRLEEIEKAAKKIGLQAEIVSDARYPKSHWQRTGYILVSKKASKNQTLRNIAKELANIRKQTRI
jgi:signal recognition particle subunit SRP19